MKRTAIPTLIGAAFVIMTSTPLMSVAMEQNVTSAGVPYLSGGTNADERRFLARMHSRYSAWLIMRVSTTGAELRGAHLRVIDEKARKVVFDRTLADAWLLLDLPEGRYQIEATFAGRIQRWAVVSHPADAIPHDLYLDVLA